MLYSGDHEFDYSYAKDIPIAFVPHQDTSEWYAINNAAMSFLLQNKGTYFQCSLPDLKKRGLEDSTYPFFYAWKGKFKNRIIIPFIEDNKIMFFQARSTEAMPKKPKYLNAENAKASHVLFPYRTGGRDNLYITEGPINAITLQIYGLNATSTQTCKVSKVQMEALKTYEGDLVIAYDNDSPGNAGAKHFRKMAIQSGIDPKKIKCCPPLGEMDWNDMHLNSGVNLKLYIPFHTKDYNYFFSIEEKLNEL